MPYLSKGQLTLLGGRGFAVLVLCCSFSAAIGITTTVQIPVPWYPYNIITQDYAVFVRIVPVLPCPAPSRQDYLFCFFAFSFISRKFTHWSGEWRITQAQLEGKKQMIRCRHGNGRANSGEKRAKGMKKRMDRQTESPEDPPNPFTKDPSAHQTPL